MTEAVPQPRLRRTWPQRFLLLYTAQGTVPWTWSANPLGYAARCEATWVDGRLMFSLERDAKLRADIRKERQRLLQLAIAAGANGGRRAKEGDPNDAYWRAEENQDDYCCRNFQGGRR